jgi:lipoic acid synthetase
LGKLKPDKTIRHLALGRAGYAATLKLQRRLHAKRCAGDIGDMILSVEHDPVFTIGRSGSTDNLLVPEDVAAASGIEIFDVERGGDITYHGPGQLVLYPILDLREYGKDVHRLVEVLEEAIVRVLKELGIDAAIREGFPGVWVGSRKIASLGVYVKSWVSYHGVALNVAVNSDHFRMIRPCGLPVEAVSINDLREPSVTLTDVLERVLAQLGALWDRSIVPADLMEVA